jgi:hypothetical protein
MSSYSKIGIPKGGTSVSFNHPFKIDIGRLTNSKGELQYTLAVAYHSRLYTGMSFTNAGGAFLQRNRIDITGLDFPQNVPTSTFPGQNYYCVLKITITDLQATRAEIIYVSDDNSVNQLQPVKFESSQNRRQTEARIIIGVLVWDDEAVAGLEGNDSAINTVYLEQFVTTDLIMCNMVFDGLPVVYPVPFIGGRLNF